MASRDELPDPVCHEPEPAVGQRRTQHVSAHQRLAARQHLELQQPQVRAAALRQRQEAHVLVPVAGYAGPHLKL